MLSVGFHCRSLWYEKNRNGDGFIDREEFADILRSTGEPITEEEIEELMTDGDTNKDGKIDFDGKMNTSHVNTHKANSYFLLIVY